MVAEVNKLIHNTLLQGRDLFLPEVGTLVVRRNAASRAGSTKMAPPCRTVTFTGEKRGESLLELIVSKAGVDNTRAEEIYSQWLQSVKSNDVVTIEGVGTIANRKFTEDKAFSAALNPMGQGVVALPARKSKTPYIVAAVIIFAAAVAALLWFNRSEPVEVVEPVVETVVTPAPEPEPVVVKDPDVMDMTEGASYAVWGVFSQKENALKYKNMIERKYGDIVKATIYHHKEDTMYLLALAEYKTRNQCIEFIDSLHDVDGLFDDMWIFTNR